MAWERRTSDGPAYYYRARRGPDGRVKKTFLGRGEKAQKAAQEDARVRARRAADRAAAQALRADMVRADELDDKMDAAIELLTDAVLLANGIHKHRGQYRRVRHGCHTDSNDSSPTTQDPTAPRPSGSSGPAPATPA